MRNRCFFLLLLSVYASSYTLNRFRYLGYKVPELSASWSDSNQLYTIQNSHLSSLPLFSFNIKDFEPHFLLNQPSLAFRYNVGQTVSTALIEQYINETIDEINNHKKKLTHADILQQKNFNWHRRCGLLVLKLKNYPFVIKLFMETPETFTNPYCKGIEPICFFYMGSGASRHLTGWLRIKNLVHINDKINSIARWKGNVETPNKKLLIPKQAKWIKVTGTNIDGIPHQEVMLPSTYAIVADYIKFDHEVKISSHEKTKVIMQLCNDLDLSIDPHRNNFIFYFNKQEKKLKMVIIDTEHFPTMVGNFGKKQFKNYSQWYLSLIGKCFEDTFLTSKDKRNKTTLLRNNLVADSLNA